MSRAGHALGRALGGALRPWSRSRRSTTSTAGQLRLLLDVPGARADLDRAAALDPQDPLVVGPLEPLLRGAAGGRRPPQSSTGLWRSTRSGRGT
ncbi:MAG: hypothetical protein KIT58_01145 [Planctomycetota bacterium]|nr:hypothetical protein [Planctomycetota bacterium]